MLFLVDTLLNPLQQNVVSTCTWPGIQNRKINNHEIQFTQTSRLEISGCSHSLYSIPDADFKEENTAEDLQGSRERGINLLHKVSGGKAHEGCLVLCKQVFAVIILGLFWFETEFSLLPLGSVGSLTHLVLDIRKVSQGIEELTRCLNNWKCNNGFNYFAQLFKTIGAIQALTTLTF